MRPTLAPTTDIPARYSGEVNPLISQPVGRLEVVGALSAGAR
ncbi:hypothetical protein [Leifsonia sp. NPDC077715]